jgi:hypothetical protein
LSHRPGLPDGRLRLLKIDARLTVAVAAATHDVDERFQAPVGLFLRGCQRSKFLPGLDHEAHALMDQVPYGRDLLVMLIEPLLDCSANGGYFLAIIVLQSIRARSF